MTGERDLAAPREVGLTHPANVLTITRLVFAPLLFWLVLDAESSVKEGEGGHQTVIIEYPTREAAEAAYGSGEYQAVVGIRLGATENGRLMIVDGFEMPS